MLLKTLSSVCLLLVVGLQIVSSSSVLLRDEQIPKPDDILAVAKSPLEPVTLPQSSIMGLATTAAESNPKSAAEPIRTTRAAQSEDDSASTDPPESDPTTEQPGTEPSTTDSTKPEETTTTSSEATSTTEIAKVATDDTTSASIVEATTTTTTTPAPSSTVSTTTTTTTDPTTTTEAASDEPATTEAPASPESEQQDTTTPTLATTLSTTVAATTESTTTTTTTTTTPPPSTTSTTTTTTTTTASTTTSEPETTTSAPEESKPSTVTETPQPSSPVTESTTTESTPVVSSTQRALEVTSPQPVTEKEPKDKEEKKESNDSDKKEDSSACNHFPTYSNDEVQKVFREETTYKNGTIKGKFTYINFDRRYRLVHYTRLPYGPIKVDQVEELGNPSSDSQSLSPVSGDSDNAILQLRNIMPDSLFGFPFVGPQGDMPQMRSANPPPTYSASKESLTPGYTTDTLLTPNLLSPSVPVSVPPNFPRNSFHDSHPPQANNPNNQPPIGQQSPTSSEEESKQQVDSRYFGIPSYHYPTPEAAKPSEPSVYSYYPFQSALYPSMISGRPSIVSDNPVLVQSAYSPSNQPTSYTPILQQHQPHKHEHFIAPFMFVQPFDGVPGQPLLNSKIKIRVKSSKAIQSPEPGKRPTSQARQGRTGKQNQDLKNNVNDKPLVYHVLRGPVRVFDMPQHEANLALGYDSVLQVA